MKTTIVKLITCASLSITMVVCLYAVSNKLTHKQNSFHRYFPPHPILLDTVIHIKYNSYYFSGYDALNNNIYLGNITAPLHLLKVNLLSKDTTQISIKMNSTSLKKYYAKSRILVIPPDFYLLDGITPKLLKGNISSWKASEFMYDNAYFNEAIPIGPKSMAIRSIDAKKQELVLGKLSNKPPYVTLAPNLLKKQWDGIFCTDGALLYNTKRSELIYIYYYRNQYLIMDTTMQLVDKRKTIDTNSIAKIKSKAIDAYNSKTMTAPPFLVNKNSYTYNDYLLVHSNLMAKNESPERFKNSTVIDVYNLKTNTYDFSFYINGYKGFKLKRFMITDNHLLAIHHNYLIIYELNQNWFSEMKPISNQNKDNIAIESGNRNTEHLYKK
ncbi:hypothetical protein [Pseudotamlana agarivorans]|uniref:hypothetical protein n=1 Tax=Pseudotamlana agarivorans TaxID=481183 RepID=UPI0008326200|nr:hypothetical protein [Tamlana agarivorans]